MVIAVFMLIYSLSNGWSKDNTYSHAQFYTDLDNGKIAAIDITPNSETPTGNVLVKLKCIFVRFL